MKNIKNNTETLDEFITDNIEGYKNLNKIYRQIASACKIMSNKIKRIGLDNLYGSTTITNFHGEEVQALDVICNDLFINSLSKINDIYALVSEENNNVIKLNDDGNYIVTFDPLDGSSNINCNINIGSIFAIYKKNSDMDDIDEMDSDNYNNDNDILQCGDEMISAGYCLYGTSTMFVLATKKGVNGFTLDENYGEFIITHSHMRIPQNKKIYSINEGNCYNWSENVRTLVNTFKKSKFSARYIGSMVGDVHRTLIQGGVFMYPASTNSPNGKLRLLYEVAPMSYIIEKAGGSAIISSNMRALSIVPNHIHQRSPIFLGSKDLINIVNSILE